MLRSSRSLSRASTGLRSNQRMARPWLLAQPQQVVGRERELALADALGRALEIGEVVARHFLVRADQQVRELPPGGAGLREQLGNRRLQQLLGEQERGLERHAGRAAGASFAAPSASMSGVAVEEPARLALEQRRQQPEHLVGGHALAALDHARGTRPRAPLCESSWMQRADSSSSVRPLRLRSARSLVPRKWLLRVVQRSSGPLRN